MLRVAYVPCLELYKAVVCQSGVTEGLPELSQENWGLFIGCECWRRVFFYAQNPFLSLCPLGSSINSLQFFHPIHSIQSQSISIRTLLLFWLFHFSFQPPPDFFLGAYGMGVSKREWGGAVKKKKNMAGCVDSQTINSNSLCYHDQLSNHHHGNR